MRNWNSQLQNIPRYQALPKPAYSRTPLDQGPGNWPATSCPLPVDIPEQWSARDPWQLPALSEDIKDHMIGISLPSQSVSETQNQEKKPTNLCAPREFLKMYNHTILSLWLQNKQTFRMLSLCDLRFALCSLDLRVLRAQRIMGFLILITHKSMRSENSTIWDEVDLHCNEFILSDGILFYSIWLG